MVMLAQESSSVVADREMTLIERLRQAHAMMVDAVLHGDGLEGVAELAAEAGGGAVAIVVPSLTSIIVTPRDHPASRDPGALRRWVGERVRGRPAAVPADVLGEVPIRLRDEVVGVVALLRSDAAPRPDAVEFLHVAAAAALTDLAIEDAKVEVEQNLCGSFLEELRSRQDLGGPEIVRRGARLGCDLSRGAVILCAELTSERPRLVIATITAEHPGALAQQLDDRGRDGRTRVDAALPPVGADGTPATALESAKRLSARLAHHGIIGLSSFYSDPAELGLAAREAELVLDVLRYCDAPIAEEIGSSTYKLLFRVLASHPEQVRTFYEATIAPMVRYDDQYGTELVRTLQAYLDANCNMNATAGAIFAHRHTIAYRLDRVRELTGLDPTISEDRERLGLSLKVHRLIGASGAGLGRP
jgi:sugar diacid utilization regulator